MKKFALGSVVIASLALVGCSSVPLDEEAKAGSTVAEMTESEAAAKAAAEQAAQEAATANQSVYFAFDSYSVDAQYLPVIEKHARRMIAQPAAQVVLEGNTDSRGSREYNLALGQKRSEAVKQRLQLLGIPASRIEAVSFGREKPKAAGENEESWAQNRRVDFSYR